MLCSTEIPLYFIEGIVSSSLPSRELTNGINQYQILWILKIEICIGYWILDTTVLDNPSTGDLPLPLNVTDRF